MEKRTLIFCLALLFIGALSYGFYSRYHVEPVMMVEVEEIKAEDYPEDPAIHHEKYGIYGSRKLKLIRKENSHFDFIFETSSKNSAQIELLDIDLSLFTPRIPHWMDKNSDLAAITLVERQWNRQQVTFNKNNHHLRIQGGDGFEKNEIHTVALTKNCLNAGLFELQIFTKDNSLLYQGWFTLPLGHYKNLLETLNDITYWNHFHRLEFWFDPAGKNVPLESLRKVVNERKVKDYRRLNNEKVIATGEQERKRKTMHPGKVKCFGDFCNKNNGLTYASFVKPGRYDIDKPWNHEYERISYLEDIYLRKIKSPKDDLTLYEIELYFRSSRTGEPNRFIVGGIDVNDLPPLSESRYNEGLYMPMGIAIPPFFQDYFDLKENPPNESFYYSVLLDRDDRWVNHHQASIDGPILHRDRHNPNLIHLYLLSYERHSLIAHFVIPIH